jgi:hypothetical protein
MGNSSTLMKQTTSPAGRGSTWPRGSGSRVAVTPWPRHGRSAEGFCSQYACPNCPAPFAAVRSFMKPPMLSSSGQTTGQTVRCSVCRPDFGHLCFYPSKSAPDHPPSACNACANPRCYGGLAAFWGIAAMAEVAERESGH